MAEGNGKGKKGQQVLGLEDQATKFKLYPDGKRESLKGFSL